MDSFMCSYCCTKHDHLNTVVKHCIADHPDKVLKYRELVFDEHSGTLLYQTKLHVGIVPYELEKAGKLLQVRDNQTFILDQQSKKKLNTPVKWKEVRRSLSFEDVTDDTDNQIENETDMDDSPNESLGEMERLLPDVLRCLQSEGQVEACIKFNTLLASNAFPMDNICYLLFLDIMEWFSCSNTSRMRYRPETVKFWQVGFRLFHGKFLRFVSGLRNFGQVLEGVSERGAHDPAMSKLNFAVPSRNNLYPRKEEENFFYPSIRKSSITAIANHFGKVPMKLSVDGKKISRGKGKLLGDIDCWGFEAAPTLEERKQLHVRETKFIETIKEKIENLEEQGMTIVKNTPNATRHEMIEDFKKVVGCLAEKNKLLRNKVASLEQLESKFKTLGGDKWKASRLYPVICSVRMNMYDTKKHIEESLSIANKLAFYGATANGSQRLFSKSDKVVMMEQENFFELDKKQHYENSRFIPQRSKNGSKYERRQW